MKNFQLQPDQLTVNQQTRALNNKNVLRRADNSIPHHFDKKISNKKSSCHGNLHQNSKHRLEYKTLFVLSPVMSQTKL